MSEGPIAAPESGVSVRMYRAGLGDCFLLTFRGTDGQPVHVLIDCGIHSQFAGGGDLARRIVEDVRVATGGHLHVLVVTHEHGDHISGFHAARDVFEAMTIDALWFAWTEDPADPLATSLDRARALMLHGLRAAEPALAAAGDPSAANVRSLLGFFDVDAALGVSSRQTRDGILDLCPEPPRYLQPKGPPLTLPGVEGVRIFVLGPPRDVRALMRARPSSRPGEVYHEDEHALSSDEALSLALLGAEGGDAFDAESRRRAERAQPFAGNFRQAADVVAANPDRYRFFHERYGFHPKDERAWRRIDSDWQVPAESIALKLDAATNNTSLVLAIELMATGKVLLFAADAQVGNWQSWHDGGWSEKNGLARGEVVDAESLLRRTVLYKVGHHGSHNATLREKGLELMTSPDLCAMIPVVEDWALARRPYPWRMPFSPLYAELLRRTGHRILRTDLGVVVPDRKTREWTAFQGRTSESELHLDLEVPDA